MSVYITRDLYLSTLSSATTRNRPIIGWHSVVRQQDISASVAGVLDNQTAAIWSPDTYTFWRSAPRTSATPFFAYINLSNPAGEPVDYLGIAGHNFADNETGTGYTFQLQHTFNGTDWVSTTAEYIAANSNAIVMHFPHVYAQNFRLAIRAPAHTAAPGATFAVAHLRMGRLLRLQRKIYVGATPFTMNKRVEKVVSVSDSGKYLGSRVKSIHQMYEFSQQDNDPEFVREHVLPFLDHADLIGGGGHGPKGTFFGVWRPDDYPDEVLYCHPPSNISRPNNQRPNGMMQWSLSGEAEA